MSSAGTAPPDPPQPPLPKGGSRTAASSSRRIVWLVLKWTLFVVVTAFVANRAASMWRRDGATLSDLAIHWRWMALAILFNTAAWLPSVWFWQRLMRRMGSRLPFLATARAYYCGHLGKYVPGKAAVVIIRTAMVKQYGARTAQAALAVTYETLAMMGSGAAVAVALAPQLLSAEHRAALPGWLNAALDLTWLPPLVVILVIAALLPVLALVFTHIAARMTPAEILDREGPARIDAGVLASGLVAYLATWGLHGLSLWATLRGLGVEAVSLSDLPVLIGAVAFATSAGFAVLFAPGGLGVREGLLIAALSGQSFLQPSEAVAAAVVTRVIALLTEVIAAAVLSVAIRPSKRDAGQARGQSTLEDAAP